MTDEEAQIQLKALSKHFNEPVMPVSKYCESFKTWFEAIQENFRKPGTTSRFPWAVHIGAIRLAIQKSSFLNRMIYCGQAPRTVKCPKHQGHWQGLFHGFTSRCPHGCGGEGWLVPECETEIGRQAYWRRAWRETIARLKEQANTETLARMEAGLDPYDDNEPTLQELIDMNFDRPELKYYKLLGYAT